MKQYILTVLPVCFKNKRFCQKATDMFVCILVIKTNFTFFFNFLL